MKQGQHGVCLSQLHQRQSTKVATKPPAEDSSVSATPQMGTIMAGVLSCPSDLELVCCYSEMFRPLISLPFPFSVRDQFLEDHQQ